MFSKKILQQFFFFLGGGGVIFVLLLYGPILKYRKNKSTKGSYELIIQPCFYRVSSARKHFSLVAENFSLFFQEGHVTSPLISGPAWTLKLQFSKYQQRYVPMIFFFFFFFFVIPLTVYIRSTELYKSKFMCMSYYLPQAYNAPVGGALVLISLRKHML